MVSIIKSIWFCTPQSQKFLIFVAVYVLFGVLAFGLSFTDFISSGLRDMLMMGFQAVWIGLLLFHTKLLKRNT